MSFLYISVVSHGHFKIIQSLDILPKLSVLKNVLVVIRDNLGEPELADYCKCHAIEYICNDKSIGFAANNNRNFLHLVEKYKPNSEDFFLVLNPDVVISPDFFNSILAEANQSSKELFTVKLYKDFDYSELDISARSFPTFFSFVSSFFSRLLVGQNNSDSYEETDWCSGAFMLFRMSRYSSLNGFDESFFMYCEDIDICKRNFDLFGDKVRVLTSGKAVHFARRQNNSVTSPHFRMHLRSIFAYLLKHKAWLKP